jgi:hypothetical protein
MQRKLIVLEERAQLNLNMNPFDIVRIGISLTIGDLLNTFSLRFEQKVYRYSIFRSTIVLLTIEINEFVTVQVNADVMLSFSSV